jgi:hypothetical protein
LAGLELETELEQDSPVVPPQDADAVLAMKPSSAGAGGSAVFIADTQSTHGTMFTDEPLKAGLVAEPELEPDSSDCFVGVDVDARPTPVFGPAELEPEPAAEPRAPAAKAGQNENQNDGSFVFKRRARMTGLLPLLSWHLAAYT